MSSVIKDGAGTGSSLKVDSFNRAHTQSVNISENLNATLEGNSYNINTGLITITGDATLIYLKNNEDTDLVIEALALGSFEGITHSDDPYITLVRNPTGGDLILDGTAVSINQNRNFGSSNTLTADAYKGKVGGTLTGGNDIAIFQATPGGRSFYAINFTVPKGSSVGVKLTANASSGSASWYAAIICYLKDTTV
jgi:hypothetical protein